MHVAGVAQCFNNFPRIDQVWPLVAGTGMIFCNLHWARSPWEDHLFHDSKSNKIRNHKTAKETLLNRYVA
jgi:hypothetical protein